MSSYVPIHLTINKNQVRKLIKGEPIQLRKEHIGSTAAGCSKCLLHPATAKHVLSCKAKGKGCRIHMSNDEMMQTGEGWGSDLWDFVKKAVVPVVKDKAVELYKFARDKGIPALKEFVDSDYYQRKIRPAVGNFIRGKAETLPFANVTEPLIDWSGDKTNAWGKNKPKTAKQPKTVKPKAAKHPKTLKPKAAKPKPKPKSKTVRQPKGIANKKKGGSFLLK